MANRTKLTPKRREQFISELLSHSNVAKACESIGVHRQTAYQYRDKHPDFKQEWDEAIERGTDALVQEAYRRAHAGVEEPIYYLGEVCGTVRKYSDTLLIFLLKSHRPNVYRETVNHKVDVTQLSDEELERIARG